MACGDEAVIPTPVCKIHSGVHVKLRGDESHPLPEPHQVC